MFKLTNISNGAAHLSYLLSTCLVRSVMEAGGGLLEEVGDRWMFYPRSKVEFGV